MKRIITTVLFVAVFSILFTFSVSADVKIEYNPDTLTLGVSGVFEDSAGKSVTLQILKPGKIEDDLITVSSQDLKTVLNNIKETNCNSEGVFQFTPFKINGVSGHYSVRVCLNGQTPLYYEKAFLYVAPAFETEVLQFVCDDNVTVEELADKLADISDILQFPEFSEYDREKRIEITNLVNRDVNNCEDITANVNIALAVYKINNANDANEVKTVLKNYENYISAMCGTYDIYLDMDSDGKNETAKNIMENKKYESTDDFISFFGGEIIFTSIYTIDNYLQLEDVLKSSEKWFDSDFSSYYKSKSKKKVAIEVIGKKYNNIAELERAIEKAIENAQEATSSKGNGGTSGGGGGSVITVPQIQVPPIDNAVQADKPVFTDMDDAQWAVEAVNFLSEAGIINGVSKTEFAPNSPVTREQFIKMVVIAFGNVDMQQRSTFSDCPDNHWSSPYVASAFESGIVTGISDTEFGIGQNISRQDMAVMLYRAAKNKDIPFVKNTSVSFVDEEDISPYAKEAIDVMSECGVISGIGDDMVAPLAFATRAQAAKMIYTLMKGE